MATPIRFYGLSTCIHCKHTREYLEENNIPFSVVYVDQLAGEEREQAVEAVRAVNPRVSFPTLIINGKVVVGFDRQAIEEALAA